MRLEPEGPLLFNALVLMPLLIVVPLLAFVGLVIWWRARRQFAGGGSWRYTYGNAPTRATDTTLSQA